MIVSDAKIFYHLGNACNHNIRVGSIPLLWNNDGWTAWIASTIVISTNLLGTIKWSGWSPNLYELLSKGQLYKYFVFIITQIIASRTTADCDIKVWKCFQVIDFS